MSFAEQILRERGLPAEDARTALQAMRNHLNTDPFKVSHALFVAFGADGGRAAYTLLAALIRQEH